MSTAKAGPGEVKFLDAGLLAMLDHVSGGAASRFTGRVRPRLEAIMGGAVERWPVKTGESKRGFSIRETATPDQIRVEIVNAAKNARWGAYAYKIRYSAFSRAERIELTRKRMAEKGASPAAISSVIAGMVSAWNRKGRVFPSQAEAGLSPWVLHVRTPAKAAMRELLPDLRADLAALAKGA
jgi:hypothetical protein